MPQAESSPLVYCTPRTTCIFHAGLRLYNIVMSDAEYTSYCGLYCLDCIPSDSGLFLAAKELQAHLQKRGFEEYARIKVRANKLFEKYAEFSELLQAIINLKCSAPCRKEGGKTVCPIRDCAQSKCYEGCWECDRRQKCELLDPLRHIHTNIDYHLDLIAREGMDNWSAGRKNHYSWE
jgi:hypothetical protein